MEILKRYYAYILFAVVFVTVVLLNVFFYSPGNRLNLSRGYDFNDGWYYESEELDTFPSRIDVSQFESYTIYRTLDERFDEVQYIIVRTSLSNVKVTLDNVVIYEVDYNDFSTYASMWHMIRLPENASNQVLEITYESPYRAMSGVLNEVRYGQEGELVKDLLFTFGFRLLTGIFSVIIGLILMIGSAILYRNQHKGFGFIGLFSILLGMWVIGESRLLQFFTGNVFFIGSISYIMVAVFPIPMNRYMMTYVMYENKRPYQVLEVLFALNAISVILFYLLGIRDFFTSATFSVGLLLVALFVNLFAVIYQHIKSSNEMIVKSLKMFIIISFFAIIEAITFLFGAFDFTSIFAVTGVIVIMTLALYSYVRFVVSRFKLSYEKEFYQKLAYYDPLTTAKNRLAFEEDFEHLFTNPETQDKLRLIYCDLDDLKSINDVYGHLEGDEAIKKTYQLLVEVFGTYGDCYRLGGDEFACFSTKLNQDLYNKLLDKFKHYTEAFDEETEYRFKVSLGSVVYDKNTDLKPSDMLKRSDDLMYKDKQKNK